MTARPTLRDGNAGHEPRATTARRPGWDRFYRRAPFRRKLAPVLTLALILAFSALISAFEYRETLDAGRPLPGSSIPAGRDEAEAPGLRPALPPEPEARADGADIMASRRRIDVLKDRARPEGAPVRERSGAVLAPPEPDAIVPVAPRRGKDLATRPIAVEPSRTLREPDPALLRQPAGIMPDAVGGAYMLAALAGASILGAVGVSSLFRERRANRRKSERRRISQPGCIHADLLPPLDCTILDISLGGARLGLDPVGRLPPEFTLVFQQTGVEHRVQVRWRKQGQLGVQFLT